MEQTQHFVLRITYLCCRPQIGPQGSVPSRLGRRNVAGIWDLGPRRLHTGPCKQCAHHNHYDDPANNHHDDAANNHHDDPSAVNLQHIVHHNDDRSPLVTNDHHDNGTPPTTTTTVGSPESGSDQTVTTGGPVDPNLPPPPENPGVVISDRIGMATAITLATALSPLEACRSHSAQQCRSLPPTSFSCWRFCSSVGCCF